MINATTSDGNSSDTADQRLRDGVKNPNWQKNSTFPYHNFFATLTSTIWGLQNASTQKHPKIPRLTVFKLNFLNNGELNQYFSPTEQNETDSQGAYLNCFQTDFKFLALK